MDATTSSQSSHGPDDPTDDRPPSKTEDPTVAPETLGIDDTDTALAPEGASAPVE